MRRIGKGPSDDDDVKVENMQMRSNNVSVPCTDETGGTNEDNGVEQPATAHA